MITSLYGDQHSKAVNSQRVNGSAQKRILTIVPAHHLKSDVAVFNPKFPLTRKYRINPADVGIKSDMPYDISKEEKAELIEKVLESYELAQKNLKWGNIARIGYASNIGLSDGTWHLSSNFNNTRNDISSICGERSAIMQAFNDKLKSIPLEELENNPNYKKTDNYGFHVNYVAMSNNKELGTDRNAGAPCTDCLSWFNTNRFFDNETKIVTLVKNDDTGSYDLCLRNLVEMLPYRMETDSVNTSNKDLEELPIEYTDAAKTSIEEKNLTKEDVISLINNAKQAYDSNELAIFSKQNFTSAVLANNETFLGKKADWSRRWFVEPAEHAATKAIEKYGLDTHIDAIAYYGEGSTTDNFGVTHNDGVVNIQTLGRLNTKYGNPDTLVVTVQDNKIAVRTIGDYMPAKFGFVQDYVKK